ncbi:MAG TPA: Hsp70 family protein, partial [Anaerolineales bacterium]|nr:Hsp70 family protein [Anaerolineales bacterium]
KRRALITAKNNADSLAYQTEKTLNELGDKVPASDKSSIEEQIKALRKAAEGDDIAHIKEQTDSLQNAFHALSQQLYAQQGQQGAAPSGPQSGGMPGSDFPNYGGNGQNGNGSGPKEDEGEILEGEFTEE